MVLKAILFGFIAVMSAGLLLLPHWSVHNAVLLGLCIWACCRLYYFAFYVIERYIDPTFRFSGLWSAFMYVIQSRWKRSG